jgi:hypothetical protein
MQSEVNTRSNKQLNTILGIHILSATGKASDTMSRREEERGGKERGGQM